MARLRPHRRMPMLRGAVLATFAPLFACGPSSEPPDPGAAALASIDSRELRVVSLSPVASEFVLALGAAPALAGIDRESQRIPGLGDLPVVDLESVVPLSPDLVLVSELHGDDAQRALRLRDQGLDVTEVAPHTFDDAFALCRTLGARLVGADRARVFEKTIARELAQIAGASFGLPRPRVAAVVGVAPLVVAGGHSFTTDLIEIAGGDSVTHGDEAPRIAMSPDQLLRTAPDLLLVTSATELTESEQRATRAALPDGQRVAFFTFDAERFWVRDAVAVARRLRAVIEPLSRELERSTSPRRG